MRQKHKKTFKKGLASQLCLVQHHFDSRDFTSDKESVKDEERRGEGK